MVGQVDYFVKVPTKDYFTYKILYENGGVCLDLDTISVGDMAVERLMKLVMKKHAP